jgi:regulator of replication initiation timing
MDSGAGWEVYSKMVLQQLENLNTGMAELRSEIQEVKTQIAEVRVQQNSVTELKQWKERIDDIVSPTQLDQMKKEVQDLKDFKTKALAGFTVIQFLMGLILFYDKLM